MGRHAKYVNIDTKKIWMKNANLDLLLEYMKENFHYINDTLPDTALNSIHGKVIKELPDQIYGYCEKDRFSRYLHDLKDIYDDQVYYISMAHWLGMKNSDIGRLVNPKLHPSRVYYLWNQGVIGLTHIITIYHQDDLDEQFDRLMNMKRISSENIKKHGD